MTHGWRNDRFALDGTSMYDDAYIDPTEHLLLLGSIFLAGTVLACRPQAVLGLHYQCVLSMFTGIRCPFCGMTRDFILISQGFLPKNNPGSLTLAVAAYVGYPLWLAVAASCRPVRLLISRKSVRDVLAGILLVLFIGNNFVR